VVLETWMCALRVWISVDHYHLGSSVCGLVAFFVFGLFSILPDGLGLEVVFFSPDPFPLTFALTIIHG